MPPRPQFRHFSTVTRVYPPYLPYLHVSTKMSKRWIAPTIALAAVGLGVTAIHQIRRQHAQRIIDAARAEEEAKMRRQLTEKRMLEAYGDRTSLNELEEAVRVYREARS